MRMIDLIEKKKQGQQLSPDEIREMIRALVAGDIPDYQMSALLMAIWFKGMSEEEISCLTAAMAHSGDMADLSAIPGFKVDKHSTGGVGDKTTLITGPIVASCGVRVAKMSGKGLGFTGGTIDKLEAIPGFRTDLPRETFFDLVNTIGIAVIGQSGNMVPADKKLYALRDVTATVDSIPLIASSIMSKKLAGGSDGIVLDVKTGSGAFMKTKEEAARLAEEMVGIGTRAGRSVTALITNMDEPLGREVGNALEVREALEVLSGGGPEDLRKICLALAGEMLITAGRGDKESCYRQAREALDGGKPREIFYEMVKAQGGDTAFLDQLLAAESGAGTPSYLLRAERDGFITRMNAETVGIASGMLKAGRSRKEDSLDYRAGITLCKKTGDPVREGDILAILHAADESLFAEAADRLRGAYTFGTEAPAALRLLFGRVSRDGTDWF